MIEIKNISKKYGRTVILDNISFNIEKGDCIGIVGENGSGKSTLLSILAGTLKADSGELIINGKNAFKNHGIMKNLIGYVPQENPLIDELTVLDNLKLWYCNSKTGLKEELENGVLKALELNSVLKKEVQKLSGGMKKRLSIGIALAGHPPILILDEPEAALDINCRRDIHHYLADYIAKGGTILITSHNEKEISLCNKIFLMNSHHLKELKEEDTF